MLPIGHSEMILNASLSYDEKYILSSDAGIVIYV